MSLTCTAYLLKIIISVAVNQARICLVLVYAVHAHSFNDKLDYISKQFSQGWWQNYMVAG